MTSLEYVIVLALLVGTAYFSFRFGAESHYLKGYRKGWMDGISVLEKNLSPSNDPTDHEKT